MGLVLNRLFIIIGVVAILAIAAAFVVPSFVPWDQYRDRLAAIAGEVLGTDVRIDGDVSFSLLPQPRLTFSRVSAGPADAPSFTVDSVEAEFSLIDFLRDRYHVTRLRLDSPAVQLTVAPDGSFATGFAITRRAPASNISIADASLIEGTIRFTDRRSGESFEAAGISGELELQALRGPFNFAGRGVYAGGDYAVRLALGALDASGGATLSASLRPLDDRFSFLAEGTLATGPAPSFDGTMTFRQPPPKLGEKGDAGRGDLVMTSKVRASTSRVLLSDYVLVPDENRATTRLLGAAEVALGARRSFNAVVSGGLLALPPRDATAEQAVEPYELVRLVRELPVPLKSGLPGTIGVDIAELNLRAFSLRNVRFDARTDGDNWSVERFTGMLPGETSVTLKGEVTSTHATPDFAGTLSIKSARLDAFSAMWRKPSDGNPLFGSSGGFDARVDLVGETLSLSDAHLVIDGASLPFSAQMGIGGTRDLHLSAQLGKLDQPHSAALVALLPDLAADPQFAASFPRGEFEIGAETMSIAGLVATGMSTKGNWDGGVLVFDKLAAEDFGGVRVDAELTAFGSFARPELSGSATLSAASADAPALARFYSLARVPPGVVSHLAGVFPAELRLRLDAPSGEGAQSVAVAGKLGPSDFNAMAQLEAGFLRATNGPIKLRLDLKSPDAALMTAQLGLGDAPLFAEGVPGHLVGMVEGSVGNSLETTLFVQGGEDTAGFSGNVVVTNPAAFSGRGTLKVRLAEPSALATWMGADGIVLPALAGSASLAFDGSTSLQLSDIRGTSGDMPFEGHLALGGSGETRAVTGELSLETLDAGALLRTIAGSASLLATSDALWPSGPVEAGRALRTTTGRVAVTASKLTVGDRTLSDPRFDLDWDAKSARIRKATASIGSGTAEFDLSVCCAGNLPDKQIAGRVTLAGVALDDIAPGAVADALDGKLDLTARFDGTGDSLAGILGAMTGEGTYSVSGLRIERLDPGAPATITAAGDLLEMQPEQLAALIEDRLDDAPLSSPGVTANFTIAGGILRNPNVSIEGDGGSLFGSGSVSLADLGLTGSYVLTPTAVSPATSVEAASAQVTARLGGTLLEPTRTFDVSSLVDAFMVKAYEAEVARLEKLRAEDEARREAEKAEQARLAAEQERIAAERAAAEAEAKRKAEAEEAERQAAARREEQLRKAIEEANKPMDLGLPSAN